MKKDQKIETKVYELFEVKLFKKATFKLEEIIHRKDKGKNINYHIKKLQHRVCKRFYEVLVLEWNDLCEKCNCW